MIHLKNVTGYDYRKFIKLKVKDEQKKFVSNNSNILAKAYAFYDESRVYGIYDDDLPVGLSLIRAYNEENSYIFDQLMIDEKYQGKGYGKLAAKLIIDELKKEKQYSDVLLCYVDGDDIAKNLYLSLGFEHTGVIEECDDGSREIVMKLIL